MKNSPSLMVTRQSHRATMLVHLLSTTVSSLPFTKCRAISASMFSSPAPIQIPSPSLSGTPSVTSAAKTASRPAVPGKRRARYLPTSQHFFNPGIRSQCRWSATTTLSTAICRTMWSCGLPCINAILAKQRMDVSSTLPTVVCPCVYHFFLHV